MGPVGPQGPAGPAGATKLRYDAPPDDSRVIFAKDGLTLKGICEIKGPGAYEARLAAETAIPNTQIMSSFSRPSDANAHTGQEMSFGPGSSDQPLAWHYPTTGEGPAVGSFNWSAPGGVEITGNFQVMFTGGTCHIGGWALHAP